MGDGVLAAFGLWQCRCGSFSQYEHGRRQLAERRGRSDAGSGDDLAAKPIGQSRSRNQNETVGFRRRQCSYALWGDGSVWRRSMPFFFHARGNEGSCGQRKFFAVSADVVSRALVFRFSVIGGLAKAVTFAKHGMQKNT